MFAAKQHKGSKKTSSALFASAGNAFIQPKLNIGKPNDKYEKEADHVADKVVNKTNVYGESPFFSPLTTIQKRNIQKQEDKESVQEKPIAETITPLVQLEPSEEEETIQEKCHTCEKNDTIQKQDNEEEENVQAKTNTNTPKNPIANLSSRIQQNRGRGKPLDKPILTKMQQGFGADFSTVKIHTDSQSVAMNRDLGARAFTNKNDIFFNDGEFNPQSKDGQTLLAHELTHTIQQGASARMKPDVQKRENVVDMAELIKQIIQSNKEQKDALDPTKANETRKDAATKGVEAEAQANSKIPEVEPSEPDLPETDVDTDASRIATPIPKEPDVVVPSSQKKQDTSSASQNTAQNPAQESTSVDNETQAASNVSANKTSNANPETTAPKPANNANNQKEEGGQTLKYLEQESADVCNKGAEKAQQLADNESAHDTAEAKANQTEVAVVPPEKEGQSRGNADQVKTLEKAQAPESNDQAIKREMDKAISDAVPKKIKELNEFESGKKAQVIGNKVLTSTAKQVGEVKGTYNEIDKKAEAHESDVPVAIPSIEQSPNTPALNLGKGAVPSVPQEQTDLSNFEEEADNIYEKEGISKEMQAEFENVDSGDIAEANKEKSVLKDKVANEPANLQDFAKQKQNKVETDLQAEEAEAKSSMEAKRQKELESAKSTQVKTKTEMEKKRETVTQWINNRYTKAKDFVNDTLNKLETQALNTFDAGQKLHAIQFEQNVKRRVNTWKSDRYSGFWGAAKWVKDKFVGIDHFPEIKTIFTTERATFVKAIDVLILNINKENEKTIQQCKEEIVNAKTDIQEFIDKLGPDLIDVGKKAQEDTAKKLAKLDEQIDQEKKKLQQKLCDKKDEAIKAIDKKIEAMKSEMGGLVSKLGALLLYAAKKFFKWAISKIGGNADKIISILDKGATVLKKLFTDPIGFFKNLVKAVGGGIKGFVTNIVSWLKKGLVSWLMGQMGDSGLELPKKFDMKGIIFLGLQVAGLTWNVIRARIVKNLGPKGETIMSAAEKTVDIIKRVVIEGPIALWNIIVEKAGEIKTKVMEGIRNWAITQIIKKMSFKLMSMLNPAGAILQAIMLLYDVVMFFIENWNRIVDFVKSVFDSVGEIASGALGKASQFIENTLGKTVPIILSFAARFVGLSGIGKAIRKVIKAIQKSFKKILDKMIKFLVKQVKKLFKSGKAKVKGAVTAIIKWWKVKQKVTFKNGEKHTLFFKGIGKNAKLFMRSSETSIENRIAIIQDPTKKNALTDIYKKKVKDPVAANAKLNLTEIQQKKFQKEIGAALAEIGKLLGDSIESDKPTTVTHTFNAGRPERVIANPLTKKAGNTQKKASGPRSIISGNTLIKKWIKKTGKTHPQTTALGVHILADHLHGPWTNWNVVFGSKSLNENMTAGPELKAKMNRDEELKYDMTVSYYENTNNDTVLESKPNPTINDLKSALGFYVAESIMAKVSKKNGESFTSIYNNKVGGTFPPITLEPDLPIHDVIIDHLRRAKETIEITENRKKYNKTPYTSIKALANAISKNNNEVGIVVRTMVANEQLIKKANHYYIRKD